MKKYLDLIKSQVAKTALWSLCNVSKAFSTRPHILNY